MAPWAVRAESAFPAAEDIYSMPIILMAVVLIALICTASGVVALLATWGAGFFTSSWRLDQEADRDFDRRWGS